MSGSHTAIPVTLILEAVAAGAGTLVSIKALPTTGAVT